MSLMMKKLQSQVDGTPLELLMLKPYGTVKGIIQMCHGMAENKERYLPFFEKAAQAGFVVAMHDHRGHGKVKDDDLGYFHDQSGEAIVEDVVMVTRELKKQFPGKRIVLFGHSMGSLVVRCVMKKYDQYYAGLVVCGSPSKNPAVNAAIALVQVMSAVKGERYRSPLIDRLAFGSFNQGFEATTPHAWICSDEQVQQHYEASDRCGYLFTLNGYLNLFRLMKHTYDKKGWQVKRPNCPILFIVGEQDPCRVSEKAFQEAVDFMRQVGYKKVEQRVYPNVRHEILNDVSKDEVTQDVIDFAQKAVQQARK